MCQDPIPLVWSSARTQAQYRPGPKPSDDEDDGDDPLQCGADLCVSLDSKLKVSGSFKFPQQGDGAGLWSSI